MDRPDLEQRRRALTARDREIGLEVTAETALARADRLAERLDLAQA